MTSKKTIINAIPHVLKTVDIPELGTKQQGKVRDFYVLADKRVIITTDRQSAFDVILGEIPYKGTVLNLLASFWFDKSKKIIPNHKISLPDPNVIVSKNCEGIPIEMIVRGYISGVTNTSIWGSYQKGDREIYGIKFPDGLVKNQKLPKPVITPTTHGGGKNGHDERLTQEEILKRKLISPKLYKQMEEAALALYDMGSKWCEKKGLILVDTKYEFGLHNGKLTLMDEIHTPDSSRFWIKKTYKERFDKGMEPENFDKEFLRLWYAERGYKGDGTPPKMAEELIVALSQRYIQVYETITGKTFKSYEYPIEERIRHNVLKNVEHQAKMHYHQVGDNYTTKDPIKKLAQVSAKETGVNLKKAGFEEVSESRGESAYIWKQGSIYMASVIEGLGTKNLIADQMRKITGKTYYDIIAHETIATIINDLITVGAKPLVLHAYWAIEDNEWLLDTKRMSDLINGWKKACDLAGVSWGGGETATMKNIVVKDTCEFGGSAVGIIKSKKRMILDNKLRDKDRIILIKSNGVNANGISLTRAIASKLPKGYATKLSNETTYGDALLTKTNVYANLIQDLLDSDIDIHYISNITGHGMRKIMRARGNFSYIIEKIYDPQEIFLFIQRHAGLSDYEVYDTYNMGQDYALFLPEKDIKKALSIIKRNKFTGLDAGYIKKGEKKVCILPKNITFTSESLDLR